MEPVYVLVLSATLSEQDLANIREVIEHAQDVGYTRGYKDGRNNIPEAPTPIDRMPEAAPKTPWSLSPHEQFINVAQGDTKYVESFEE
jgi:hypothetical protein